MSGRHMFLFSVTLNQLLAADGVEGLNEHLDEAMEAAGVRYTATDITYELVTIIPPPSTDGSGEILIRAFYEPEDPEGFYS